MEDKLIDYRLFDPANNPFGQKSDKATFTTLYCSNSDNCRLYAKGECIMWSGMYGHKCEFGKKYKEIGMTRRANKYTQWINKRKEKVKGINQLNEASKKMQQIGDFIYFPYPHWYLSGRLPDGLSVGHFQDQKWIPKEMFNIDLFELLVSIKPMAMMGGEITSYQKEQVPKMVIHLKEEFPLMFKEWKNKYNDTYTRFSDLSNVGRKAKLSTLKKNVNVDFGRKGIALWDGIKLEFKDYDGVFFPVKGICNLTIIPKDDCYVTITDDSQININTIFKD